MATPIVVSEVSKSFTMHLRDGIRLPVVADVSFSLKSGECAVLGGPSGAGKSSILKMLYGNYAVDAGQIIVKHRGELIDLATASPRTVLQIRRDTIGYVSQFLRTVPRVSALDVVAEPLVSLGEDTGRRARPRPRIACRASTCPKSSGACRPRPSPAASSSASTSRAASSRRIRCCCSTSRRHRSTPGTARWWSG